MFTWIFDRQSVKTLALLLVVAIFSGCGGGGRFSGVTRAPAADNTPKSTILVGGREIQIKGPRGFCIDNETSQVGGDLAFVLLGNCQVVSPSFGAQSPNVKALLTASISASDGSDSSIVGSLNSMDQFFRSETGRTALSRSSDPSSVEVLETFSADEIYFIRASDTSEGIVPGAADDYWRAYFDLHDQIVSVSVIGFETDPIAPDVGLTTLREFVHLIRDQNGVASELVVAASEESEEQHKEEPAPKKQIRDPSKVFWTIGLLRKLVN